MADDHDPQQPISAAGSSAPDLERRVARLELELDALRRQVAGGATARELEETAGNYFGVAAPAAPPPPPPSSPMRSAPAAAPAVAPLQSAAWHIPHRAAASAPESRDSLENRLGAQVFNRIAIVLLLIGTAYFLKLVSDRHWIGPIGRVLIGLVAGAGLVLWSERFRRNGYAAFSYSLKAVGSGVLYLSLWAAFQRFQLLPASAAFALMLLVTAWNAFMAWAQDSELLAAYALIGGFATPLLVSTGGNHEIFLFSYLLALDVAIVALVRLKSWPRLLLGTFPLTMAFYVGWYAEYYATDALAATSLFIALFWAVFCVVSLGRAATGTDASPAGPASVLRQILLPLANAAFAGLAGYSVLQDADHHAWLPWLMVVLAAAYLALMRAPQTAVARAIHLSLAIVFLTIAIPLKTSGAWITASWLVEGLALLWVAQRLGADAAEAYSSRTLRGLGAASLALGFCGVCFHLLDVMGVADLSLWNKGTGTALTAVAIFAAAAWLALRAGSALQSESWVRIAFASIILIAVTAGLLTPREVGASWNADWVHTPFATTDFFMALLALAIFAGLVAVSLRAAKGRSGEDFWPACAVGGTIAFNFFAVLTGVREISAVWSGANASEDAALRQALAISAWLMLYGAALLAAGFWKRSSFLRWQGLILLLFTICKVFLYDIRNLSQGYRVASFLALGALLLAVSFAYQKDLLNLRAPRTHEPDAPPEPEPNPGDVR